MTRFGVSSSAISSVRLFGVTVCAVVLGLGAGFVHDAVGGSAETAVVSLAEIVEDDTLDPRIIALALEGNDWNERLATLDAVLFAQADAQRRLATTSAALMEARREAAQTERTLAQLRHDVEVVDERIEEHRLVLQARALELFVSHGEENQLDELHSVAGATEGARHRQLASEIDDHQLGILDRLEDDRFGLAVELVNVESRFLSLTTTVAALEQVAATAAEDLARAEAARPIAVDAVRDARRYASIAGLDLSVVALDAYLRAESTLTESHPSCRIAWWMIAGVGRVESRHGALGDRVLDPDGRPDRPIIGRRLDGGPGVKAVVDTDDGILDGDLEWDRAVGPMQFIPETWSIRGRDGNGDGVADVHNLYDAAVAAGLYLCRLGGDLSTPEHLRTAYFGYNTSVAYVDLVEFHALRYAATEIPSVVASDG